MIGLIPDAVKLNIIHMDHNGDDHDLNLSELFREYKDLADMEISQTFNQTFIVGYPETITDRISI